MSGRSTSLAVVAVVAVLEVEEEETVGSAQEQAEPA
jgi:hypothetical protein